MSKVDQATIIILDVGRNVSTPDEKNEQSFFDKAVECTRRIIERKIISQGQNLLGIILLGSKKTDNPLAEQCDGDFRHIEISTPLRTPTWQMIKDLPGTAHKSKGNWFDALIVAADHLKNGISGIKIINKKIILITNFQATLNTVTDDEIEKVLDGYIEESYDVDVIGPDLYSEENEKNIDMALARQFVEKTHGATATFEDTMRYLLFHRKKAINPTPWNVDLSIGPNIKIPVSAYIRIRNEPVVKKWSKAVKDPVTNTASTSEAISKTKVHINTENQSVVPNSLVLKGYYFGEQYIPFADCDKSMIYQSGPKCLSVYGFTSSDNISWQNFNGDGLTYIFGRKNDKKAQKAITCLVQCLAELNLIGIVRRVYNNGNAPKMFALLPVIDMDNLFCLSMIELCFKEDIKNMSFPPTNLKKYDCTDKQVNAFKDLIKAMDLTKAYEEMEYDDTEAFPIAQTVSPSAQYVLDCIAFRAMNPGKPLPEPREDIKSLFNVPPLIVKRSKEPLEQIKDLFVLNKTEVTRKDNKMQSLSNKDVIKEPLCNTHEDITDMPKIKIDCLINTNTKLKVGTLDPIKDYEDLKVEGVAQKKLATQMSEAIQSLIVNNLDGDFTKALRAMSHFREDCVKNDPTYYNDWLKSLKFQLMDQKKNNIIDLINDKNLNFILEKENSLSTLKSGQESEMYEYNTVPMLTDVNISSEVNDIFDNM